MDDSRSRVRSSSQVVPFFDNGPVLRQMSDLHHRCRKLQFDGVQVISIRMDGLKASIEIADPVMLEEHFEEKGFGVNQEGLVRLVWRKHQGDASD